MQDRPSARVLVADDNPAHRRLISAVLEAAGISPDLVCDGQQAVTAVASASYDLIFMDRSMPVMDGLAAVRLIRQRETGEQRPRTPIYMASAQDDPRDVRAAHEAGADGHIAKPLSVSVILHAVSKGLGEMRPRPDGEPLLVREDRPAASDIVAPMRAIAC
jgi:CheY-like chemotaxis protein